MARVYESSVRIERHARGIRVATLPVGEEVRFGIHDELAQHYEYAAGEYDPYSATLDYVVAAVGG